MKRFCQFILLALLICLVSQTALAQPTLTIQGERAGAAFEIQFPADVADLDFSNFELTSITLPEGLTNLKTLDLSNNDLLSLTLPDGLTELEELYLYRNRLHFLTLPNDLINLKTLNIDNNKLNSLVLPKGLANLETLNLNHNNLRSVIFLERLGNLNRLYLGDNRLTSLTLPAGLANLTTLNLNSNRLTSLTLPEGLMGLKILDLRYNPIEKLFMHTSLGDLFTRLNIHYDRVIPNDFVTYYAPPVLTISRMDGVLEITWNGGVLQSTTDLFGEWQDLESAESPLRILFPSEAMRFFRLRL